MVSELDKNTIECVAKIQGKISYDENSNIARDDLEPRLLDILGNIKKLEAAGATSGLVEGKQFNVEINGSGTNTKTYKILKCKRDPITGFDAAIIQDITDPTKKGEVILWADGSRGFNNIFSSPNPIKIIRELIEVKVDWGINDLFGIGSASIFPQLDALKQFAEEYGVENIDRGIGSSMMGVGMSALAFTKGFENVEFSTYSGCLSDDLYRTIATTPGWGLNLSNGANLKTYITPGEPLTNILEPHIGANTFYMKEYTDKTGFKAHGAEAYLNSDGNASNYYQITQFFKDKYPIWKIEPRFKFTPTSSGHGYMLQLTFPVGSGEPTENIKDAINSTSEVNKLMQELGVNFPIKVQVENETYNAIDKQKFLNKINIPEGIFDDLNPTIKENTSSDNEVFLFKENNSNKIILPKAGVKPVDYSPLVSDMKDIINGKELKRSDLAIQGNRVYIPTSSTNGSPTLQNVYYQYTTKPSSGLLSNVFTVVQIAACILTQNYLAAALIALETGIAGDKIGGTTGKVAPIIAAASMAYSALSSNGFSALIAGKQQGVLTGAASGIKNPTSNFKLNATISSSSTGINLNNLIDSNVAWYETFKATNVIVNDLDKISSTNGKAYNVNFASGSVSGSVNYNKSQLLEPDVSTPDYDQRFKIEVGDRGCPLILDLDDDGIETLDIDKTDIYFNTQNTQFSTKTGWASGDEGILVADKNNDGKITQQSEMFGNESTSGFAHLKEYDTNNDGFINSKDAHFSDLKIWQDINENGITDKGELKTLTERGVTSIDLSAVNINQEQNQNTITGMSTYTTSDGKVHHIYNVNLAFNKIYTQYTGDYCLSVDVIDMPWLRGYGQVKDLQLKMSEDESFKQYVKELLNLDDAKQIYDKMDEFLAKWIGCENIEFDAMTNGISDRQIAILDKYLNLGLTGTITADKKVFMDSAYINLKNKIYANFIAQTELGNAFEINYDYKTDSMLYNDNTYQNLVTNLVNQKNFYASYIIAKVLNDADALDGNKLAYAITEKGYGASLISYLNSGFQFLEGGEVKMLNPNTPMYVIGTSGNDVITGTENADIIYGMDGDDILNGGAGDDYLSGGNGNDILIGGDGNDTLDGGAGDDDLQGGYGNDTYIYSGEGKDTIIDERWVKIARQEWYLSGWWIFKRLKSRWVYQNQLVDAGNDTVIFGDDVKLVGWVLTQQFYLYFY